MENQQMLHAGAVPRGAPVHAGIPNVVAGPFGLPALHRLRARYVRDWTMLSSVHFGAAERYRNKHRAGMVTLAIVALYGAIITVLGLAMKQSIDAYVFGVLEHIAMASTWVTLIFGLVELPKNHHVRAGELRSCAETLDELQRELAATALSNECQLSPYIARYRAAMERCGTNPDIATLPRESDGSEPVTGRRLASVRYHVSTYSYYVGMAVAPVVVGIAIWWLRQT